MRTVERRLVILLILTVLTVAAAVGVAYGKYVKQESFPGGVELNVSLGSITLQEHQAQRQPDGSYTLTETVVYSNSYELLPGLDIPKDPTVTVTKANTIPVYVYLEVTDTISDHTVLSFTVDPVWQVLSGTAGANGGAVYVYAPGGTPAQVTDTIPSINVLTGQTLSVSQKAGHLTGSVSVTFYAAMRQAVDGQTPAEIYSNTTDY